MPMRNARHPLGRKAGLNSTADLMPSGAEEAGFLPVIAAPMAFSFGDGRFVDAWAAEFVPDKAERDALAAGSRVRVILLGKTPIPLRVGLATTLPDDTATMVNDERTEIVAQRLSDAHRPGTWINMTHIERLEAKQVARAVIKTVFEVFQ